MTPARLGTALWRPHQKGPLQRQDDTPASAWQQRGLPDATPPHDAMTPARSQVLGRETKPGHGRVTVVPSGT